MIESIRVENFKAFVDSGKIPLRPITVIFGPNSAGKSSILHSLLFMNHGLATTRWDVHQPRLAEETLDFGGYMQLLHKHEKMRNLGISSGLRIDVDSDTQYSLDVRFRFNMDFMLEVELQRDNANPNLNIELSWDGTHFCTLASMQTADSTFTLFIKDVENSYFVGHFDREVKRRSSGLGIDTERAKTFFRLLTEEIRGNGAAHASLDHDSETVVLNFISSYKLVGLSEMVRTLQEDSSGDLSDKEIKSMGEVYCSILYRIIGPAIASVKQEFAKLLYLGPLRSLPDRYQAFSSTSQSPIESSDSEAWRKIRWDEEAMKRVNQWLSSEKRLDTPYKIERLPYYAEKSIRTTFAAYSFLFGIWHGMRLLENEEIDIAKLYESIIEQAERVKHIGLNEPVLEMDINEHFASMMNKDDPNPDQIDVWIEVLSNLRKMDDGDELFEAAFRRAGEIAAGWLDRNQFDIRLVDVKKDVVVGPRDVGVGISQVLPILVHAFCEEDKIIAIEQPEIHLHPALQAELADVFIESALQENGNQYILETHSEHLILRILRRIREGAGNPEPAITPEDVSVIYVGPDNDGSTAFEIQISEEGEFLDPWPGGFFPERLRELFGDEA